MKAWIIDRICDLKKETEPLRLKKEINNVANQAVIDVKRRRIKGAKVLVL